jgi:hypothetical protein
MDEHAHISSLGKKGLSIASGLCKTGPAKLVHLWMIVVDLNKHLS